MSSQPSITPVQPRVWEQRWHSLREEWVLFTAHRNVRPWIGELKRPESTVAPSYDATCALCPGNRRIHGVNPAYTGAYWFTNDLPCFGSDAPQTSDHDELYLRRPASGTAEAVCYHPDHGKTMAVL